MIYSNRKLIAEERELDFGTIYQVSMGERGRGRRLMTLTCPKGTVVEEGENPGLTIGLTKSGKPRINKGTDRELYLMLSSEGGYTRKGDGYISCLFDHEDNFKVLTRGNGADGIAGRIGTWDCVLLQVLTDKDEVIRVRTSGEGYGTPTDYFVIASGHVYHCYGEDLEECCGELGVELPERMTWRMF